MKPIFQTKYKQTVKNDVSQYLQNNITSIVDHETLTESEIKHICGVAESIVKHRDGFQSGNSFVMCVMNNDLRGVINYSDKLLLRALKFFILVKLWVHPIYNQI